MKKMMRSKNRTSTPYLVYPTNNLLTKIPLKIINQTKMPSKHLLKIMSNLLKREEMKTQKMMMKRWSKKTKIMGKREKMRKLAKMKKRLRMIKKSKSKKKRGKLKLMKKQACQLTRSSKHHHHLETS